MKIADLIQPFQGTDAPPPVTLGAFFRWSLSGAWGMIAVAVVLSALAGAMEAATAYILGLVVDKATELGPEAFFSSENALFLIGVVALFMVLRPALFGLSSIANNYVIMPNIPLLVMSRLNRWTLGQSASFFDNDFAGRDCAETDADGLVAYNCCQRGDQRDCFCSGVFDWISVAFGGHRLAYIDRLRCLACRVLCFDPLVSAPYSRAISCSSGRAGQRERADRGHHHQYQDGQTLCVRSARGNFGTAGHDGAAQGFAVLWSAVCQFQVLSHAARQVRCRCFWPVEHCFCGVRGLRQRVMLLRPLLWRSGFLR